MTRCFALFVTPQSIAGHGLAGPLASLPSPSNGMLRLGPISLHLYGILIGTAVLVGVLVGRSRYIARGSGGEAESKSRARAYDGATFWAVLGGLIGARLYHVVTDYELFEGNWGRTIEIWNGGFAIWGAVMGGAVALWIVCRRRHLGFAEFGDSMVPGIAFAQAIGRWGNYCNQELFGGPSSLPWAVEIDPAHRPAGYEGTGTFQPTFLYESLWCLGLAFALLWIDRRYQLVRGQLICLYIAGYTAFRLVMEEMRIDPAHTIGPLRVNAWVSIVLCIGSVALFVVLGRRAGGRVASGGGREAEVLIDHAGRA